MKTIRISRRNYLFLLLGIFMAPSFIVTSTQALSVNALAKSESANCLTQSNDNSAQRRFTARREGKDLRFSFFATDQEKSLGLVRYEIYALHDQKKAKKNDLLLPWGPCDSNDVNIFKSNAYKKTSKWTCGEVGQPCNLWVVEDVIKGLRDEANGAALVGYDGNGKVILRLYRAFFEKLDGTFTGRLWSLGCKSGKVGDPLSRSVFLGSKAFLSVIGLATYNTVAGDLAGYSTFALDHIAIAAGVDPETGISGKAFFTIERESTGTRKISRSEEAMLQSSGELLLSKVADKLGDKISLASDSVTVRQLSRKSVQVAAQVKFTADAARQFLISLDQWSSTAKTWKGVCDVWKGKM